MSEVPGKTLHGLHKIGHNLRIKLERQGGKIKTQANNSKLKEKSQGFGKTRNAVCR